jgi:hypothetical protein
MRLSRAAALVVVALDLSACHAPAAVVGPAARVEPLRFLSEYVVPHGPDGSTLKFGGISGLASLNGGRELLGVADDREQSRVYRFRVEGEPPRLRIVPTATIPLQTGAGAPAKIDPEGIAVTGDGHILISSEGIGNEEPRLPPAILEYSASGEFVRQLEIRPRFAPAARGEVRSGVRANAAFESLTIAPDGRLFTAAELPLVQDSDVVPFGAGSRTRLLEYRAVGGRFRAAREFAYDIDGMEQPAFAPTTSVNGVVELLALGGDELLALERGYTESAERAQSLNRIRIFRLSLAGATDISAIESLRDAPSVTPVQKTLLLDLKDVAGLSPSLTALDNFEGMAWGPSLPDGRRQLLIVSDDNFSAHQVTAFLSFAVGSLARAGSQPFR